jgi:hypothetical protein
LPVGLGVVAVKFGGEERISLRCVMVWIGRVFPVSDIKSAAFFSSSLKSIVIPWTVEILGSSCFSDC